MNITTIDLDFNHWQSASVNRNYQIWFMSILASIVVGLTGMIPIVFIPFFSQQDKGSKNKLKLMLSFAVGGLLGDVFLHLLPEAWSYVSSNGNSHYNHLTLGFWVLCGVATFVVIQMIIESNCSKEKENLYKKTDCGQNYQYLNNKQEDTDRVYCEKYESDCDNSDKINLTGYLSVVANSVDNFTHGLAVAASFIAGYKIGILTTFAIIIHEVPHEFGDFAILMKAGFSKWNAVKAQISTAIVAVLGTVVALSAESNDNIGSKTAWIIPYSGGAFLYIAMCNILPDLMKEDNPVESVKQLICIMLGVAVMGLVNRLEDITSLSI